jgi:hypothetical protein
MYLLSSLARRAKDLFVPEPSSKLTSGLKRSFVATLLRMTAVADGWWLVADG